MNEHAEAGEKLEQAVKEAFPDAITKLSELSGSACLDVSFPEYQPKKEWANIFIRVQSPSVHYSFSIVDEDTGYGDGADCIFGHIPTLIKYMKRIFPPLGPDLAKLAYEALPRHPANREDEPEKVCRVCGYAYDRDLSTCTGAVLRAAMRK